MTNGPPPGSGDLWHRGQVSGRRVDRARRAPGRRPQGPRRWLAATGYAGLAAVCLCLAAVAFLLVAPPLDAVRDRLIDEVDARTGRRLSISGPASWSLFPRPAVSFSGVAMLAPGGTKEAAIATVPSVEIEVSLWSLLLRQPQVGRLTLRRPTINLAVDAEGRRNWEFTGAGRKRAAAAGDVKGNGAAVPAGRAPPKRRVAAGEGIGAGSVRVIDATVRYRDERSGSRYEVSSLNLDLRADGWEGRADLDGTLVWRGKQARFSGSAMPARALLAGQTAQLSLKISAAPVEAAYEGTLALADGVTADGKASLKAASARAFGDWLGADWPARSENDALALAARVTAAGGRVTLSRLEAALGEATLAGSLAADIRGRPKVRGKLRVSELDFSRLLVRRGKRADVPAAVPLPAPAERGRRNAWSDQAIDPRLLALADADLRLSVGRLVYKGVRTGRGRLSVAVKDGLAKVAIEDVELYGGRGEGMVTLDGTGPVLAVGANLELAGVSVLPLLKDAGGVSWLDGRGKITLALSGRGVSERRIVEALGGKVEVAVADGFMTGIDIGKIVRNVQRGRLASLAPAPKDRTQFSALTGTFDIAKGTARSRDLKLASAHLHLEGEGDIELGPRRIDYALRAKIAGGPPAEGATVRIGTLEVPIGIKGPLEAPTFTILGQEALTDAVRRIGKNLEKREVQDAIKGLLSGDREKKVDPRDLIEKLLR